MFVKSISFLITVYIVAKKLKQYYVACSVIHMAND